MKDKYRFIDPSERLDIEQTRESLTYWKDVWRRFRKNKLAIIGLIVVLAITVFAIVGPFLTPYKYSDQRPGYINIPPRFDIYKMEDGTYLYLNFDTTALYESDAEGTLLRVLREDTSMRDLVNRQFYYAIDDQYVIVDFSYSSNQSTNEDIEFSIIYEGVEYTESFDRVSNQLYPWGSDTLGRDLLTRVMYGARISLLVALAAAIVNFVIGILYGAVSGLLGGAVDGLMMRIVDIINSIPLMIYVILIMVMVGSGGLFTIILTLGLVYWVSMARLVRGQVLSLKEQEFILAAEAIGVPTRRIITRHLVPNAIGPIIVSMTMMIPSAIFTEAFLSFIGLGVTVPQASWGTLANNAAQVFRSAPYQLLFPASAIAITILAFNFLGDGLRSALDPKLRKG